MEVATWLGTFYIVMVFTGIPFLKCRGCLFWFGKSKRKRSHSKWQK